jgi:cell division septum initiation protein DivIVA
MLEDIRQKIEQLIARYEAEKAENQKLREELQACKETGNSLREQIMELESEIETRKLTEAFTGGGDRAAAKEKVDTLIREIGKCISCLED